jgi:hypothetical protein
MGKTLNEISTRAYEAMERLGQSQIRLVEALDNGAPNLDELETALEEMIAAHGDGCQACVKARILIAR